MSEDEDAAVHDTEAGFELFEVTVAVGAVAFGDGELVINVAVLFVLAVEGFRGRVGLNNVDVHAFTDDAFDNHNVEDSSWISVSNFIERPPKSAVIEVIGGNFVGEEVLWVVVLKNLVRKFIIRPEVSDPGEISACWSSQSTPTLMASTRPHSLQSALITGNGPGS